MQKRRHTNSIIFLGPVAGSLLFIILYITGAALYPGGSQHDLTTKGFSWMHNYWCNLLNADGMNRQPNAGRSYAVAGMIVLAATLLWFWVLCAVFFFQRKGVKILIVACGTLSIVSLTQLSSAHHDIAVSVSSLFGLIAMFSVYAGLFRYHWMTLFAFGMVNLLLVGLNNYLYYGEGMLYYLPVVQKITFLSWLLWVCAVSLRMATARRMSGPVE